MCIVSKRNMMAFVRDIFIFSHFQMFYSIKFGHYNKLIFITYFTNLEVYEETDDKNINKSMWS